MCRIEQGIIAAFLLCLTLTASAAAPEPLVLAVHPYLAPEEIVKRFTPLADYLALEIKHPVQIRVGRNYAEHIDSIGANAVDIAYMGPSSYVKMVATYGKKPLLARQEVNQKPTFHGVIFVRKDSPIQTLADLKGKRFAYGDLNSTMSHVVPLNMLANAGVPEKALAHHEFLGAHKNVTLAVLTGDYDAGAVKGEVFQEMAPKGLRALATSPPVADHLFVASARLPAKLAESLRRALLRLKNTPDGHAIMSAIHPGMTALAPAMDTDYDSLRALINPMAPRPSRTP